MKTIDEILGSSRTLCLVGAYGRTANVKDWDAGKDFQIRTSLGLGPYTSKRDLAKFKADGYTRIQFFDTAAGLQWVETL